jgi:hypothetical protein
VGAITKEQFIELYKTIYDELPETQKDVEKRQLEKEEKRLEGAVIP